MNELLEGKDSGMQEKLQKLKRMKLLATGLLVFMAIVYFVFRRLDPHNYLYSSIAAFSEAAMIGALADWFAVTALFRHPMGLNWIPHTAIIQKNKDRIGESLSNFVVSNFFTSNVIKAKLSGINFSENVVSYLKQNKETLSEKLIIYLPAVVRTLFNSKNLSYLIFNDVKNKLKDVEIYPYVDKLLQAAFSSELHVPVIKQLLVSLYKWVSDNKEKTLKIIETMNTTLALPIIGDLVYKSIIKTLSKLVDDLENGTSAEMNMELLHYLPARLVHDFRTSKEMKEKIEKLKNEILDSEQFDSYINEKITDIRDDIITYTYNSGDELKEKLESVMESLIDDIVNNGIAKESMDSWIKDSIVNIICTYRHEIGNLISDTVRNWPLQDMVDKLETQVGGDMQYIRINGTVVGGLAGLAIHILSYLY